MTGIENRILTKFRIIISIDWKKLGQIFDKKRGRDLQGKDRPELPACFKEEHTPIF